MFWKPFSRQFLNRQLLLWSSLLVLLLGLWGHPLNPAMAAAIEADGATLFEIQCAGCHPQGNNIIRRGKNLKLRALQRNHVDSVAAIATLVTQGKGNMSAYSDQLSEAEIEAVSTYVWEQAQLNWR